MSMTDPISDMLTRVRNGQMARMYAVTMPFSKMRAGILDVLKREGYIRTYHVDDSDKVKQTITVELKYMEGKPVIKELKRVSKPGRRRYTAISSVPKFYNGLGIAILSTSAGILSDYEARQKNVGGELLCQVF